MKGLDPVAIVMQHDDKLAAVEKAQDAAEVRNQIKRHQERMTRYTQWSNPKTVEKHRRRNLWKSKIALQDTREKLKNMGVEVDMQIPIPDPLPKRFKGQQPSTIRAMLRHEGVKAVRVTRDPVFPNRSTYKEASKDWF